MSVGVAGTLGLTNTRVTKIFEDAQHVERELNVVKNLVAFKNDRNDDLPRQYNELPKLDVADVGEYDDIAGAQGFDRVPGNTVTPTDKAGQVFLTDDRKRANPSVYDEVAYELGEAMALADELALLTVISNFTESIGSTGAALTLANIRLGVAKLNARGFRLQDKIVVLDEWMWHPIASTLDATAGVTNAAESVKERVQNGWYVTTLGMDTHIYVTSNTIKTNGGLAAQGGIYVRDAILYDERVSAYIENERDASRRGDEINIVEKRGIGAWAPRRSIKLVGDITTYVS